MLVHLRLPQCKIALQDAETVYPFSVPLYTSKLIFCVGVAHLLLMSNYINIRVASICSKKSLLYSYLTCVLSQCMRLCMFAPF
jgi:hypothetical protein